MKIARLISVALIAALGASCSTTRVLQDDEYRLAKNHIEIVNDEEFNPSQLNPYLKQKPKGWSPFLYVYNWANGKGKTWDKLVKKIGVAPTVYDADLVDNSIENIDNHLTYLGYYGSHTESEINVKKRRVNVTYKVTLGDRIPISDLEITLPKRGEFAQDFINDTSSMTVKPGDYLSESSLEVETERFATMLRNQGYYTFNKNYFFFEADTLTYPGSAILKLQVNEYTRNETPRDADPIRRFYIDNVSISYPKTMKIREKVLTDLNLIKPGELYSENV